jgi:Porin subfamily
MDRWIVSPRARLFVVIVGAVVAQVIVTGAHTQTLTNPSPPPRAPATTARPETQSAKPCPVFGPGFVQLPGSDTCVKVGGGVRVEGGAH